MIHTNKTIQSRIGEILSVAKDNVLTIDIKIQLSNGVTLIVPPEHVVLLQIHQDFYNAYMDYTNLKIELLLQDYLQLIENKQDLKVSITIASYTNTQLAKATPISIVEYIGVLSDMGDIATKASKSTLEHHTKLDGKEDATLPVEMQLIPKETYNLRKKKINYILQNASIFDAIATAIYALGLKTVYIETPDNQTSYKQIVIPPLHDISSIFDYLQNSEAYGVYDYGINYYYMLDTLYISPMFTNHSGDRIDIYTVGEDSYAGGTTYHLKTKDKIEIVLSGRIDNTKPSHDMQENVGTSLIQQSIGTTVENAGTVVADGEYVVNEKFITNLSLFDDDAGVIKESWNQTYVIGDNPHRLKTALLMSRMEYLSAKWEYALPYIFTPVSNITYLYDSGKKVSNRPAWCKQVTYQLSKAPTVSTKTFTCTASMVIGLLPEADH